MEKKKADLSQESEIPDIKSPAKVRKALKVGKDKDGKSKSKVIRTLVKRKAAKSAPAKKTKSVMKVVVNKGKKAVKSAKSAPKTPSKTPVKTP
jgi:hypothetical protein